jgi:drug/metabolite transporter (DMT)-like permease
LSDAVPIEPQASARVEHVALGILYMLGATVVFAGTVAAVKWLVATYPAGEVLFAQSFGSLVFCALVILPWRGFGVFRTQRFKAHGVRVLMQGASQVCIIVALSTMPLASVIAINFSAPLFATLVSALFLREAVGGARWTALAVGFLGVLVVTNPGTDTFQAGAVFAVANAVTYGTLTAAVRGMTATESTETLLMYQGVLLSVLYAVALPFDFAWPSAGDALIMLCMGLGNGLGQYWWTRALHLAPASAVTPYYYFMLVWSIAVGFIVWGDVPTASLLAGSAIVVGSGLFLLWRETRRRTVVAA